ncbi:MAG: NAD(P)-dependent glycerol-3-phosphate dehydrogenase [Thermanaerothrix sp.]|nr:NAD(P)-dependent glycerol-3-phosphate dehydrogenase [Thermanaerothrix sp.]
MSEGAIISVLGAGSWGTAVADLLGRNGHRVVLWCRDANMARHMESSGRNPRYLKDLLLSPNVRVTSEISEALGASDLTVAAVPAQGVRELLRSARSYGPRRWLNLAKGIEISTGHLLHRVFEEEAPGDRYSVLSGPSHAEEVALGLPTAVVIASDDPDEARHWQGLVNSSRFRVYGSSDVTGVELGGAVKNVIAIACGMARAMRMGDNGVSALATRGLAEMSRLAMRMGADPITLSGLAGIGDLMATCFSSNSRNLKLGMLIGSGMELHQAKAELGQVAEGAFTAQAIREHAKRWGVEMPICEGVYRVLFEGEVPRRLMEELLCREPKMESLA